MTDEKMDREGDEPSDQTPDAGPEPTVEDDAQQPEAPPAATTTEPLPGPPPPRRLTRRPEGKVIAGVCTGFADYLGLDVVVVRIAAVVLALFTGIGFIGYIVAWLVMPLAAEGEPREPVEPRDNPNAARWIGIGAIVLGAVVLSHNFWSFKGGVFWGIVLIGLGIAFWGRELHRTPPGTPRVPPAPPRPPSSGAALGSPTPTAPLAPPSTPPPPIPPARPTPAASAAPAPSPRRREPSVLGRLVVGAAALAIGIGVLLDNLNVFHLTPRGMFAVLLGIVGVGLLIGARWGRARWLIFPGIVLTVMLAVSSVLPQGISGNYGDVVWQPSSRADLRPLYTHGGGDVVLDLSHLKWGTKDKRVTARVSFGELLVIAPKEAPVDVVGRLQAGDLVMFGRQRNGWSVNDELHQPGDHDLGTLHLRVEMNFGQIEVRRPRSSDDFVAGYTRRPTKVHIGITRGVPGIVVNNYNGDKR
jgi:phage shock protein PspC (stress-responsive transcriptional regulator)